MHWAARALFGSALGSGCGEIQIELDIRQLSSARSTCRNA